MNLICYLFLFLPISDHFSQIIWKNTKELGVGTAQSKSGNFFLVARYKPSGNTDGSFKDNVEAASDGMHVRRNAKLRNERLLPL